MPTIASFSSGEFMSYTVIDIENWNRKSSYQTFKDYLNPIFSISARLDVTKLCTLSKETKTSFFTNFMFVVTKTLNEIEEFRLRFSDDSKIVLYDRINPSFIVKSENGGISTCPTNYVEDYKSFYSAARKNAELAQKKNNFSNPQENNTFYITSMPQLDIVSFSNPYMLNNKFYDCIPRLMWSKFVEENGKMKMTMDIAVHHALLDGEPVCRAFNNIQAALNDIENYLI